VVIFPKDFEYAFNHAMLYEVGPFWDPYDPDVVAGNIQTREQRRKVGYVDIPQDRGGETKYGIAQDANPQVIVRDLDLATAKDVYFDRYWLPGRCDEIPYPISIIHFDGCVNHGVNRAIRILQAAVGVGVDGKIGSQTIEAILSSDYIRLIQNIAERRRNLYMNIVRNNPSQEIFLDGWMRRIAEVEDYTLAALG
jgi:lysozyme family protein